jgi:membrane peptidoglycan carboxypeptidase
MTDGLHVVQGSGEKLPEVPAVSLGSKGVAPLTMASAYAAFAARGMYCTPVAIESITQKIGNQQKSLEVPKSTCSRAMSEKTADTVNTLLQGVVDSGTGQEAGLTDRANAGKTGTTDERKNAWFVGYTPNLSGAVWVGSATQQVKMVGITIGGVPHDKVYGGSVPGPIWRDAMTGALSGKDSPSFSLVDIPDADRDRDEDEGGDGGDRDDNGNGDGGLIGGLIGGGDGGGNGGTEPDPSFSIPEGFIQGNGNGHGHGGRR